MPASAPIAVQLKAVEAEYHGLKDTGQTHKAEHVQALHAWKSKKVLEVRTIKWLLYSTAYIVVIEVVSHDMYRPVRDLTRWIQRVLCTELN